MKKVLMLLLLLPALALGGCAGELGKLENAYQAISSSTVSPAYALAAANSFDTIKAGATEYLKYCKANLANSICSADNRRTVIRNVRSGTVLRTQIEGYITASTSIPSAIYDTFRNIVNVLNASPAASFGAAK